MAKQQQQTGEKKPEKNSNDKLIYTGLNFDGRDFFHGYIHLLPDGSLGEEYSLKSKLFTRGRFGAIYTVTLLDGKVSYNKKQTPAYWDFDIKKNSRDLLGDRYDELYSKDKAANIKKKAMTYVPDSELEDLLERLNKLYKANGPQYRGSFLSYCISKITK